jgi:hypothetical protein
MPVTLGDARRSIELVSALYASAKSGQRVMMPFRQADPYYLGWR